MRYAILAVLAATAVIGGRGHAQAPADLILTNGKILTVDDQFSTQQAIAISGERIAMLGSNEAVAALAGAGTRTVDLHGRTVIPGLIDNHNHVVRATEYWPNEARLDGVATRAGALERLAQKARELGEGEWLMSLGGWTESQFADSREDFTLAELDAVAPDRPAFVQVVYDHAYGNSAWFRAMGIPLVLGTGERSPSTGLASHVVRDALGRVTGRLDGGFPMVALAIERFPPVPAARQNAAIRTSNDVIVGHGDAYFEIAKRESKLATTQELFVLPSFVVVIDTHTRIPLRESVHVVSIFREIFISSTAIFIHHSLASRY